MEKTINLKEASKDFLLDTSLTVGSRELLAARLVKLKTSRVDDETIIEELKRLHSELKRLESAMEKTPTFGCEFFVETKASAAFDPEYSHTNSLILKDTLLAVGGNIDIRSCADEHLGSEIIKDSIKLIKSFGNISKSDPAELNKMRQAVNLVSPILSAVEYLFMLENSTLEFRINPSYAYVTMALAKELFHLRILPKDVLVGYSINMVGNDVLDYGLALAFVNYYTGLTPNLPTTDDGELNFRDVHIYRGATVNHLKGTLDSRKTQLNLFAGVTAKVENNKDLIPHKKELEQDLDIRINRMILPFLVSKQSREKWIDSVYDAVNINELNLRKLQSKYQSAVNEDNIWKVSRDIKLYDSKDSREKIDAAYDALNEELLNSNLYKLLSSVKL